MTLTPEQKAEGWIEHDGGPCPVPLDSKPAVMTRDGQISGGWAAERWARGLDWWQHQSGSRNLDIIAYREPKP